jgi:hypothetical protein
VGLLDFSIGRLKGRVNSLPHKTFLPFVFPWKQDMGASQAALGLLL